VAADLDQHVGLWDVQAGVTNLQGSSIVSRLGFGTGGGGLQSPEADLDQHVDLCDAQAGVTNLHIRLGELVVRGRWDFQTV
jgi:hypothetical protein